MCRKDAVEVLWCAAHAGLRASAHGVMVAHTSNPDGCSVLDGWEVVVHGLPNYLDDGVNVARYEHQRPALEAIAEYRRAAAAAVAQGDA